MSEIARVVAQTPRQPSPPPAPIRRLAQAHRLLEQRRALVDRLRQLTERLGLAGLYPTAGDRWLLDCLEGRLAAAEAALDRIAAGMSRGLTAIKQIEHPLQSVEWLVAAERRSSAEAKVSKQDAAIQLLTEDLGTIRLWFDRYRRELSAAKAVGASVSEEDQELLTEVDGRIQQADQDAARGRYDTVAAAVRMTRTKLERLRLWEPASFEARINKIIADRVAVEQYEATMGHRAELFLIAAPHAFPAASAGDQDAPLEYRVQLRRPSFEATQESNLHDTMQIEPEDRGQFQQIIDEVAEAARAGVRSAVEAPGEPVRGIRAQPHLIIRENAAERLERIGRLMYSLLIPDAMQRLIDETCCPLTVTSNDLELPWELMHDGGNFLCLKRPFARMPVGKTFPRRSRRTAPTARAIWNALLVHSDPAGDLGDSAAEITEIEHALRPMRVKTHVLAGADATCEKLTRHLSSGRYDLIHYAGHAGFDLAEPARSFLLLHNGRRFSAERVQRVLEGRPIVFLNACDTSRSDNEDDASSTGLTVARAQGLASAFIYGGAQACVGTLWPVFDDSARDLAATFYARLVARKRVGEALREARSISHDKHGDRLTWAAYALYGDPLCRLREGASASS